jgi:hypothetical protein
MARSVGNVVWWRGLRWFFFLQDYVASLVGHSSSPDGLIEYILHSLFYSFLGVSECRLSELSILRVSVFSVPILEVSILRVSVLRVSILRVSILRVSRQVSN